MQKKPKATRSSAASKKSKPASKSRVAVTAGKQRKNNGLKGNEKTRFQKGNRFGFQPGQSGNPNGRPKSISDALRRALKQVDPQDPAGRTLAEIIAAQLIHLATKGRGGNIRIRAIQEITDRVEGKPRQSVEVTVPQSERERYESMIAGYLESAQEQGITLTREQAINYLAEADNRILTVVAAASDYAQ